MLPQDIENNQPQISKIPSTEAVAVSVLSFADTQSLILTAHSHTVRADFLDSLAYGQIPEGLKGGLWFH